MAPWAKHDHQCRLVLHGSGLADHERRAVVVHSGHDYLHRALAIEYLLCPQGSCGAKIPPTRPWMGDVERQQLPGEGKLAKIPAAGACSLLLSYRNRAVDSCVGTSHNTRHAGGRPQERSAPHWCKSESLLIDAH